MKLKVTITAVTDWEFDEAAWEGDASHEGDLAADKVKLAEEEKIESSKWDDEHLPFSFTYEVEAKDEDEIDEDAVRWECIYALSEGDGPCRYDMYQPIDLEYEYETIKEEKQ